MYFFYSSDSITDCFTSKPYKHVVELSTEMQMYITKIKKFKTNNLFTFFKYKAEQGNIWISYMHLHVSIINARYRYRYISQSKT